MIVQYIFSSPYYIWNSKLYILKKIMQPVLMNSCKENSSKYEQIPSMDLSIAELALHKSNIQVNKQQA